MTKFCKKKKKSVFFLQKIPQITKSTHNRETTTATKWQNSQQGHCGYECNRRILKSCKNCTHSMYGELKAFWHDTDGFFLH